MDDDEEANFEDAAKFLNTELGSDLSSLDKLEELLERLTKCEKDLQNEINPLKPGSENPCYLSKNADNAIDEIKDLDRRLHKLYVEGERHLEKVKPIKESFSEQMKQIIEAECLYKYLQWIMKIENESSNIEDAVKGSQNDKAIEVYEKFKEYWEEIRTSECKHLVEYLQKNMLYWHDVLLQSFGNEFQKVSKSLHWPSSTSTKISLPPSQSLESLAKFKQLFLLLCRVALPDTFLKTQDVKDNIDDGFLLLPLQLMLQPLQKRFAFHFMGSKLTNRIDKPEWYLTQILSWIADNSLFLEQNVDPVLIEKGLSEFSSKVQLMRGLSQLATWRLKSDLPKLLDDDKLLCHTIDEVLLFAQEMTAQGYPSSYPGVVQVLSSDPCFTRWKSLEHQSALEKMDKFLSLESAWKSRYQEEGDLDDLNVPESAELFITLLLTMTERYSILVDPERQVFFLELQLELLDDFRLRLHQMSAAEMQHQQNFCGILNALEHVAAVLEEWNNLPFFLKLYAYKKKRDACEALLKDSDNPFRRDLRPIAEDDPIDRSVFDDAIGLFLHMQGDLLNAVCDRVLLDIKAKSRAYRNEKWFCLPTIEDKKLIEVSVSALPMLEVISLSLHQLEELLTKQLFTRVWQKIASEINLYLYEEVILQNSFSEGGAVQLKFDMTRNLFPIFGTYTRKAENYFRLICDSCVLLTLGSAPSLLLRETLKHQNEDGLDSKSSALEELGVHSLNPTQALLVLSKRIFAAL